MTFCLPRLAKRTALAAGVVLSLSAFDTLESRFAPEPDLLEYWAQSNPDSAKVVDHSAWQSFLDRYLIAGDDGINRVAYGRVDDAGRAALDSYIQSLTGLTVTDLNEAEQEALWTNLYNALTVQVILDHYPTDSILDIDISPGLFSNGPWGRDLVEVEGQELSLDDIEHRIIRPIWNDPRVHFSVNCAALGCPNLGTVAFTADNMDTQMDQLVRAFIAHPRGVTVEGATLKLSKIFEWYDEDFGDDVPNIVDYIKGYATPQLITQLEQADLSDVDTDYDWGLNDAP